MIRILVVLAVACVLLPSASAAAAEGGDTIDLPPPRVKMQAWQVSPEIPPGWTEIDRKTANLSGKLSDNFVLMSDGVNDQIVWFEPTGTHWKMSVIESWPSAKHKEYFGVDVVKLKLFIDGNRLAYG